VDCLDRTNIVQHLICEKILREICPIFKEPPQVANATPIFKDELTYLWAMMGDFVSKEYSGTESVLTKAVLKGYMNTSDKIAQKYLSCVRFQKQTLTDDFKQICIEILTGAHNKEDTTEKFVAEYKHEVYQEMV